MSNPYQSHTYDIIINEQQRKDIVKALRLLAAQESPIETDDIFYVTPSCTADMLEDLDPEYKGLNGLCL